MKLSEQIVEDMNSAMKARDTGRVEALRMLRATMLELEKSGGEVTDDMELKAVMKQAKMRRESIEQFREAGREELAVREEAELAIIEEYLPAQMSEDDIRTLVKRIADEVGASGMSDFKLVMPRVMGEVAGTADGGSVQKIVRDELTGREKGE